MSLQKNTSENVIALGLDYNYNITKMAGKQWTPKDGLKVYFLTVRLKVDFTHEKALELVSCLKAHKHYKQMLLSIEKENAVGPCTHHVHAIIHFTENAPKPTFKQWLDRFVSKHYRKDEGALKFDYHPKAAIDVRTCYCIKDEYLTKHETSTHYVGVDDFDLESATDDLPTQDQQESLQTAKPDRVVNAVWDTYTAQWTEFAPNDSSIRSCVLWFNTACAGNLVERMPDPRKETQFLECLYRHRNKSLDNSSAQIALVQRVYNTELDDANDHVYVLKGNKKKRKHGCQTQVQKWQNSAAQTIPCQQETQESEDNDSD